MNHVFGDQMFSGVTRRRRLRFTATVHACAEFAQLNVSWVGRWRLQGGACTLTVYGGGDRVYVWFAIGVRGREQVGSTTVRMVVGTSPDEVAHRVAHACAVTLHADDNSAGDNSVGDNSAVHVLVQDVMQAVSRPWDRAVRGLQAVNTLRDTLGD